MIAFIKSKINECHRNCIDLHQLPAWCHNIMVGIPLSCPKISTKCNCTTLNSSPHTPQYPLHCSTFRQTGGQTDMQIAYYCRV